MQTNLRPSWEQYALGLAKAASVRSEDPYTKVGACVLRNDHSVAGIGYNGAPSGIDIDWSDREARSPYVLHAEENALRYVRPGEAWLVATYPISPCSECVKLLAAYGVKKAVYLERYRDTFAFELATKFGIELAQCEMQ